MIGAREDFAHGAPNAIALGDEFALEMLFVASAEGAYRQGDLSYPNRAGGVISAAAADVPTAHQIVNAGEDELTYLAFSTGLDPDVTEYPDSNKIAVASMIPLGVGMLAAKFSHIGRRDGPVDYFDGEA